MKSPENAGGPAEAGGKDRKNHASMELIHRAIIVLEALAAAREPVSLTLISRRVGLHKSTALRLLRSLAEEGYAEFDRDRRTWKAGPSMARLGTRDASDEGSAPDEKSGGEDQPTCITCKAA